MKVTDKSASTCYMMDSKNDYLVSDIMGELSASLEIPELLPDYSDNFMGYDSQQDFLNSNFDNNFDLDLFSNVETNDSSCSFSVDQVQYKSSESSSGSEGSSMEFWTNSVKSELETPPISPHGASNNSPPSSPSVYILTSDITFVPQFGNNVSIIEENGLSRPTAVSACRKIKIEPKPVSFQIQPVNGSIIQQSYKKCDLTKEELYKLQAQRKHERMIRNRESACQSRKKKKEYLTQLEKKVEELNIENKYLKQENRKLKERLNHYESSPFYFNKNKNVSLTPSRKSTALLALVVMVCLNVGSLSLLNDSGNKSKVVVPKIHPRHGRSLLWDLPSDEESLANVTNAPTAPTAHTCPMHINQSESIRLESELRRWIHGEENLTEPVRSPPVKIKEIFDFGGKPFKLVPKLKKKYWKNRFQKEQPGFSSDMDVYNQLGREFFDLDTFFEAIHRRDDTFYVVSFSDDHLLLPAVAHNKTLRPKMSLMLPAHPYNSTSQTWSDEVKMMQIDCEVTNTNVLNVNENDIPQHFRPIAANLTAKPKGSHQDEFSKRFFNKKKSEESIFKKALLNTTAAFKKKEEITKNALLTPYFMVKDKTAGAVNDSHN